MTSLRRHQNALLRESLRTTGGRAALALPALIGLAFGIASSAPADNIVLLTLGGALIGAVFVWARVRRRAVERALREWGTPLGLTYASRVTLPERTRWLRQTDGKTGVGLTGPLAGAAGGVCHYSYYTGSGKNREEHPATFAFTSIAASDGLASLSLGPRGGGSLFDGLVGFLSSDREVEMESVEFETRFALWVADTTDEVALRRIFTPAVITGLIDDPPTGRLELAGPMLVTSFQQHLVEPADLDAIAAELERWATAVRPRYPSPTGPGGATG